MLLDIHSMLDCGKSLIQEKTFLREVDVIAEKPVRLASQIVLTKMWYPSLNQLPEHGIIVYISGHEKDEDLISVSLFSSS